MLRKVAGSPVPSEKFVYADIKAASWVLISLTRSPQTNDVSRFYHVAILKP